MEKNNNNSNNIIELKNIVKTYDNGFTAVDGFNLEVKRGEFVTFLGPSGCGKTTTLRMIAGFEIPTSGEILLNGQDISKLPPNKRPINTVFQRYALFPHLNIFDNIAFGLKLKKLPKAEIVKKVKKVLEPLGALDLKMRKEMQIELKGMHDRLGITFIYVTHDQEEALTMSDKIVVMSEGEIQQIGTPEDIYNEPKNAFVADFIGESNIFNGIMTGKLKVRFCGAEFVCLDDVEIGTKVDAVVRPEDVMITTPEQGAVKGVVTSVVFKGVHYEITVESGRNEIVIQTTKSAKVGDKVGLNVEPDGIHIMISETAINKIESSVNRNYALGVFDGKVSCDLTEIVPGSAMKDGVLVDANGEAIDREKIKVIVSILPEDIDMSDDEEAGIICGHIINLIYKGDHYSYVVRTDNEEDFIVDDEYLWNMEDRVSLIIPEDKMKFSLKK